MVFGCGVLIKCGMLTNTSVRTDPLAASVWAAVLDLAETRVEIGLEFLKADLRWIILMNYASYSAHPGVEGEKCS